MFDEVLLQQRIAGFAPEPLVPVVDLDEQLEIHMVQEDGDTVDLAKANYLDILNNDEVKKASEDLIRTYGVGTCGPRAFYGTTDVHLELEQKLAEFLGMEESIIYSYGFVAISSSIAAYCKRSDVVFVDEKANFPTHQGLLAAKSKVVQFAHNSPDDLRQQLQRLGEGRKKNARKFLILEGISWATGQLCPLEEFLAVAEEYKMRVFLDETYTLGVFGATGRGLTEHYNIDPNRLDMILGTLEGAIGSIGGFCAGSNLTIEHQRLSGSGYIFSASLPTYLVKVVLTSLEVMKDGPVRLIKLAREMHEGLVGSGYEVLSHAESPFKLFKTTSREADVAIHQYCKENGVHFLLRDDCLMMNVNVKLLDEPEKLNKVHKVLEDALAKQMK